MTQTTKKLLKLILPILAAAIAVILYLSGIFKRQSDTMNDLIYQRGDIPDGTISILQIDEHSLEELGPYQTWTRDYVAEAIELLNEDPDMRPAAIGVDVLYIGNTTEDADNHLISACQSADNVVLGSYLNFDTQLVADENDVSVMKQVVSLYEEPFEALRTEADVNIGFVNGFTDSDGIIRHSLQNFTLEDGREIPSFSYAVYETYAKNMNKYAEDDPHAAVYRELDIPANSNGLFYIDYTGKPGDYSNSFSLSDFIEGEIPAGYFADGVVLIGPYAEGLMDSYTAAIDHSENMYGVEIHANILEAMIGNSFKREAPKAVMAIIIALFVIGAVLISYKGKLRYSIIYSGAVVILYPLLCMFLYSNGTLLDILYVPFAVLFILIVNIIYHYLSAAADKRRVERTFKRYVAPEIIDEITKTGLDTIKLGGEAVDCAILFVDIRGFTTMSEALKPEEVVAILNKYLGLTSSSIFKYGGTLDKFIGDATMAIFGAPLPTEDYIFKAVCAAYDMVLNAEALAGELNEKFGRSVSFGVGVHCGKAVVGNIGTERRMDYTAIGDTVNTAARLEANAPKGTVYISEKVLEALKGRIDAESVGNIPLKGKSEPLTVYKLTGITDKEMMEKYGHC